MVFQQYPMIEYLEDPEKHDDEDDACEPQIFEDHDRLYDRFCKTLYYGKLPTSGDRFSLSMTEICVEKFNDLGLEALEAKLNKLDMDRAAEITRNTCASPTSLILALIYLDRMRSSNPSYLYSVSSTDLFLVSLLVASKFLHDDGEEDEVFNDEWATSASMEKKDLNKLELEFLVAIDWNVFVSVEDFKLMTTKLETAVVSRQVNSRGWTTYTDLLVLSRNLQMQKLWTLLAECTIKVTAVCASAYAASLMTMLGTCYLLSKTSLSPANVQTSMTTIYNSMSGSVGCEPIVETDDDVTDVDVVSSLIVASLSSDDSHDSQDLSQRLGFDSLQNNGSESESGSKRCDKNESIFRLRRRNFCDANVNSAASNPGDDRTILSALVWNLFHEDQNFYNQPHRDLLHHHSKLGFL